MKMFRRLSKQKEDHPEEKDVEDHLKEKDVETDEKDDTDTDHLDEKCSG